MDGRANRMAGGKHGKQGNQHWELQSEIKR
jgi:hypothetical protein